MSALDPSTTVLTALAGRLAVRSRRALPRLRGRRPTPPGEIDAAANRCARASPTSASAAATASPRCSRTARAGDLVLRRGEARCGPGAGQHRLQGRVPAPPARRLGRRGDHRPGRLRRPRRRSSPVDAARAAGASSWWARPTRRSTGLARARLGRGAARPAIGRPACPTPGSARRPRLLHLHRGHHRAVEGLHAPAPLRRASLGDQIARAWESPADDCVLTPLPLFHFNAISVCVVGTLLVGGRAAIVRRVLGARTSGPRSTRTGATIASLLGSLAILIARRRGPPRPGRSQAAALRRPRRCRPTPTGSGASASACATFSAGYGLTEASLISDAAGAARRTSRAPRASPTTTSSTCGSSTTTT